MRAPLARVLLAGLLAAFPGASTGQDLLPSIQRIVDRDTLVIAVVDGSRPPMIRRGQDGRLSGFDVELGEDIAHALGVEPRFAAAGPDGAAVIDMVASGEADIGLSYLSESIEAGKRVFFSDPYIVEAYTVFFNRAKGGAFVDDCPSVSELRQMAEETGGLGVLNLRSELRLARGADPEAGLTRYSDMETLVAAVEAGDVVASVQRELFAKYHLSRHPQAALRVGICTVPRVRHRVAAAVRPDGVDLLRWLDLYFAQRGVIVDLDTLLYRADRVVY